MRQIQLLVVLSLALSPYATADGDQHKHSLRSMRAKAKKFLAFAYTSKRMTSEGSKPIAGTTIAADPQILPMGSRVQVTGAGKYSGIYTVSDKGGAIKGNKVDIFVGSREEALEFGRKQVYVALLQTPKEAARAMRKPGTESAGCEGCGRRQQGSPGESEYTVLTKVSSQGRASLY
ncbi:MAG TPA: 3D domain-containing protein [Bryobacteraceae bacterium]|nr:3D domain-containing protein [Bryobacteraceae bacterium]